VSRCPATHCAPSTTSPPSRRRCGRSWRRLRPSEIRSATRVARTSPRSAAVPTLVRGLDYYTRTTWEFVGPDGTAQSALSGGGRYDGLAEELGGAHTPAVGFGAGIERLLLALPEADEELAGIDVFFICEDGVDRSEVAAALKRLRGAGKRADMDYAGRSVKGQHTQASRLGARHVVVVTGETDLEEALSGLA
jgi:histidyl-tRNA synthetase